MDEINAKDVGKSALACALARGGARAVRSSSSVRWRPDAVGVRGTSVGVCYRERVHATPRRARPLGGGAREARASCVRCPGSRVPSRVTLTAVARGSERVLSTALSCMVTDLQLMRSELYGTHAVCVCVYVLICVIVR